MGNSTIFDDVLRTIQERLPQLLIPLVNEVFQTSYTKDTEVVRLPDNYQKILSKVITDSCNMMEQLKVEFADGQCITYCVPVLKLKDYSIEEIFEKNLLILLPYYIINYEKEFSKIAEDQTKSAKLVGEYREIIRRLGEFTKGDDEEVFHDVLKMMQRIMRYMLKNKPDLKERLGDVMGGKVLPLPSDKLREAKKLGLKEGLEQGITALIRTCNVLKTTQDVAVERLMIEFSMTKEQANEAVLKYWE